MRIRSLWKFPDGRDTRDSRTIRQVWLSLLWGHCSFILSSGVHKILLYPQRVCFPGGSWSFCQIPRLGNLLWALELLQQWENFFDITVLHFMCCVLCGCMVGQWQSPPRRLMPHAASPRYGAARAPVPTAGHCWPMPPQETLKHSKACLAQSPAGGHCSLPSVLVCTVLFVPSGHLWWV